MNKRLVYALQHTKGTQYDIHPEYRLLNVEAATVRRGQYHEWEVYHTPTNSLVGRFILQKGPQSRHFKVAASETQSPYHKNIGELAYKKLIGHYGSLMSSAASFLSPEARSTWTRLGARPLSLRREGRPAFIKRAEPDFSSSSLSNVGDAWLHGETGEIIDNQGLNHNDAAWRNFGHDKWTAEAKGHVRIVGSDGADGRPNALLKHRTKISGMVTSCLREHKPFWLESNTPKRVSYIIHTPSDHAAAWEGLRKHALPQTLPSQVRR
jgi:hypothetical protein